MRTGGISQIHAAIACGGTGGHLFPGLAVGECLARAGCAVTLLISPKEVDRKAVSGFMASAPEGPRASFRVATLPAVGLQGGNFLAFGRGFFSSYRQARKLFRQDRPGLCLAMGGFTSAAPVLAARRSGARTFLHESNTIPGKANRWLARWVDAAFVGFPGAAGRLRARQTRITGTPVRSQFRPQDPVACRTALGLSPEAPTLLVTGGSQGASGLNRLVTDAFAAVAAVVPGLQVVHLAGDRDAATVRDFYRRAGAKSVVESFTDRMELCLGAATAVASRAGASSLAEIAAVGVPSLLVPFPAAADNHQHYNAQAFAETGAALAMEQATATPAAVAAALQDLLTNSGVHQRMRASLAKWHSPEAAECIASAMLIACGVLTGRRPASEREASGPLTAGLSSGDERQQVVIG